VLSSYIDPVNIPKQYGGELEFEFGMMPKLEPAIAEMLRWSPPDTAESSEPVNPSYPIGPLKLVDGQNDEMAVIAVGSIDGKDRREAIATFVPYQKPLATECQQKAEVEANGLPNLAGSPLASTVEAITVASS
jgi:hypothetical protein